MWFDLRLALRSLFLHRGFALLAILTMALGIGANTAIFSLVYGVVFRPLPFKDADRLVLLFNSYSNLKFASTSVADFYDYRRQTQLFSDVTTMDLSSYNLSGLGRPERVAGATISAGGLEMFGVRPLAGRLIREEDDRPDSDGVVLLDEGFWKQRFGGDVKLLGSKLRLNEQAFTVVGVVPEALGFLARCQIYLPHRFTPQQKDPQSRGNQFLTTIGRLRPGLTMEQAHREVDAFSRRLAKDNPGAYPPDSGWRLLMMPLTEMLIAEGKPALLALFFAVGLVLLIACANVANLLLTRHQARIREFSMKAALGATKVRLAGQMLTESLVLGAAGGLAGLVLGAGLLRLLLAQMPANLPRLQEIRLDLPVLLFTLFLCLFTALLASLAPIVQVFRTDLRGTLNQATRSSSSSLSRHRTRATLVVAEVFLSLVLLSLASLLVRSFQNMRAAELGFQPENLTTFSVNLPRAKYESPEQTAEFARRMEEELKALPGTVAAGGTQSLPFSGGNSSQSFQIEGRQVRDNQSSPHGDYRLVTPGYFAAMRIPLKSGRFFTAADRTGSLEVAVIDDVLARQYWGDENLIGKRIRSGSTDVWREIVGIASHVKHEKVTTDGRGAVYYPALQRRARQFTFVVRPGYEAALTPDAINAAVARIDTDLPVYNLKSMNQWVLDSMLAQRLAVYLFGIFSLLALGLSAVGLYGVISQTVQQRTQEIGIRMALGAERHTVTRMVLGQAMTLTGIGLVLGLAGAYAAGAVMKSLLYGVEPGDALSLSAAMLALCAVSVAAALIPAWRASQVDPIMALRYE